MNQKLNPMIYVACLAAYNSGHLHGEWLEAAREPADIQEDIRAILLSSPIKSSEEYAIHDYEGFGDIRISEYHGVTEVSRLAILVEEHGEAFAAYVSYVGEEHATEESFQDAQHGHWESELAYAEHIFDELYLTDLPENLRYYIDYQAFSGDLFLEGYFSVEASFGGVFVFNSY